MKKLILLIVLATSCAPKPKGYYPNTQTNYQNEIIKKYGNEK